MTSESSARCSATGGFSTTGRATTRTLSRLASASVSAMFDIAARASRMRKFNTLANSGLIQVGRHSYGVPIIDQYEGSETVVEIGSFCSIGPNVRVAAGGNHPTDWASTFPFRARWNLPGAFADGMPYSNGPVEIGSDVWIGTDVLILSGSRIGHGAVIYSGAVVTGEVRPYAIVAGVPAREVRRRFNDDTVERLLEARWWDLADGSLLPLVNLLSSTDTDSLLAAVDALRAAEAIKPVERTSRSAKVQRSTHPVDAPSDQHSHGK